MSPQPLEPSLITHFADYAIDKDTVVIWRDCVIVPDLQTIEAAAHGHEMPDSWQGILITRDDGRSVTVYRPPDTETDRITP